MADYYLDTSALVKRYAREVGTLWVLDLIESGNNICIAGITGPEIIAAFHRKARQGEISGEAAAQASENFKEDYRGAYQIVEISQDLIDSAMALAETHNLRGYDAVQLAAAMRLKNPGGINDLIFVSADINLNAAAGSEGMVTDNPNDHP